MSWLPCNLFNLISTTTVFILFKGWLFRQWKILTDGTPCAVKVACTVWSGGKARDDIRGLPITIELGLYLYAQPGPGRPSDFGKAVGDLPAPTFVCDPFRSRRGAFVLWKCDHPLCGPLPEGHTLVQRAYHKTGWSGGDQSMRQKLKWIGGENNGTRQGISKEA